MPPNYKTPPLGPLELARCLGHLLHCKSFMVAPNIKSLIFYYFNLIHVVEITQVITFLLSCQFVIQIRYLLLGFKIVQLILLSSSQILPIGQKVQDPLLHLCEKCSLPILVYGRLVCITSIYLCTPLPVCKESCVRQPGTRFRLSASEFCSQFTLLANEFLLGNSHYRRTVINPAH